jgi:hypothetical protein
VDIFFWCRDGYKINALVSDIIYDIWYLSVTIN